LQKFHCRRENKNCALITLFKWWASYVEWYHIDAPLIIRL
jgi:hypothetical protein